MLLKTRGMFHKTRLPNKPGLFQLVWLTVKISQTNWNKPGLFGKLVLWNSPQITLNERSINVAEYKPE